MLKLSGIQRKQSEKILLTDVAFTLEQKRTLAVLGPSGSGKTTLLRLIMGFEPPTAGEILWNGNQLSTSNTVVIPPERRQCGMIFQDPALFPHLSVQQNVAFGLHHLPRKQRQEKAHETLALLGIESLEERSVESLSGGERQRVALARSLAPSPSLLLLDEPFSNVDRLIRQDLIEVLQNTLQQLNITTIIVTHDARDALDMADDVLVLANGKQLQHGPIHDVFTHPIDGWTERFLTAGLGTNTIPHP